MTVLVSLPAIFDSDGVELAIFGTFIVLLAIKALANRALSPAGQAIARYANLGILPLSIVTIAIILRQIAEASPIN